jgi:organic radical activating enzyme
VSILTSQLRVYHIFESIQGEGATYGYYATFVRLHGCSLGCAFCDTTEARQNDYHCMTIRDIISCINTQRVVITGGEPLEQPATVVLANALAEQGRIVQIETNGTQPIASELASNVWLTVSPKPAVGYAIHPTAASRANEFKYVVVDQQFDPQVVQDDGRPIFLQPIHGSHIALQRCIRLLREHPTWRLSIQTHKFIGLS